METIKKGNKGSAVKELQRLLNLYEDGIFGKLTEEALKQFQASKGLTPDGICGENTWKALGKQPKGRKINEIILHCSATPEGRDFTIADITRWHKERGFSTIGYHYVIYRDGSIHNGRDVNVAGAHCEGRNAHTIGICYIGGLTPDGKKAKDTRTDKQKAALYNLIGHLKVKYPTITKVSGHNQYSTKACPSFDVTKEY